MSEMVVRLSPVRREIPTRFTDSVFQTSRRSTCLKFADLGESPRSVVVMDRVNSHPHYRERL